MGNWRYVVRVEKDGEFHPTGRLPVSIWDFRTGSYPHSQPEVARVYLVEDTKTERKTSSRSVLFIHRGARWFIESRNYQNFIRRVQICPTHLLPTPSFWWPSPWVVDEWKGLVALRSWFVLIGPTFCFRDVRLTHPINKWVYQISGRIPPWNLSQWYLSNVQYTFTEDLNTWWDVTPEHWDSNLLGIIIST